MKSLLLLFLLLALAAPARASEAERELEAKLQHQLDAIVGPGKARVSVSGRSSDGYQSRSLSYSNQQPVSQRKNSESHSGTRSGSGTGTQTTTRSQSQGTYTYDRTEELRTHAAEPLSQKSVSVVFEAPHGSGSEDGEASDNSHPVDKTMVEDVVRSAAGIDESQGDRLSVQEARIDTSAYDKLKDEMEKQKQSPPWWIFALIGVIGVGLGAMIGLLIRRRRSTTQPAPEWQPPLAYPGYPAQPAQPNPLEAGPQGPVIQIRPGQ